VDVYCLKCAEPWDTYCFHDEAAAREAEGLAGATYAEVSADFRRRGCVALDIGHGATECVANDSLTAQAAGICYDLMGDDMDGCASMMEDFEFAGLLD